jgi:hypothetical protein
MNREFTFTSCLSSGPEAANQHELRRRKRPVDFRVDRVEAVQHVGGSDHDMKVVTYEMLVHEEKNRQVAAAILTGVAGAANAYSASRAGYGTYTVTVTCPNCLLL